MLPNPTLWERVGRCAFGGRGRDRATSFSRQSGGPQSRLGTLLGSCSSAALSVCVITPRTEIDAKGHAQSLVPLPRPTHLAAGPLNEVRIHRGGQPEWRKRAFSKQAIEGSITLPID